MNNREKILKIILAALIILVLIVVFGYLIFGKTVRVNMRLSLAQRNMEKADYDTALAAYQKVLEIEPKNADAFLGIVEVYIQTEDYELALKTATEGYEITGDLRFESAIERINSMINTEKNMTQQLNETNPVFEQKFNISQDSFDDMVSFYRLYGGNKTDYPYDTAEEIENVYETEDYIYCSYQGSDIVNEFEMKTDRYSICDIRLGMNENQVEKCAKAAGLKKEIAEEFESVKSVWYSDGKHKITVQFNSEDEAVYMVMYQKETSLLNPVGKWVNEYASSMEEELTIEIEDNGTVTYYGSRETYYGTYIIENNTIIMKFAYGQVYSNADIRWESTDTSMVIKGNLLTENNVLECDIVDGPLYKVTLFKED